VEPAAVLASSKTRLEVDADSMKVRVVFADAVSPALVVALTGRGFTD